LTTERVVKVELSCLLLLLGIALLFVRRRFLSLRRFIVSALSCGSKQVAQVSVKQHWTEGNKGSVFVMAKNNTA
jgi:hypothetical protein